MPHLRNILPYIGLIIGLVLLAAPVALDWYQASQATNSISRIQDTWIDNSPEKQECLAQAKAYNAKKGGYESEYQDEVLPYEQQLVYNDPHMGYIEIPKIAVKQLIYHGTSDDALAAGVGHLEDTSLPVGGKSSHCVLSAHTGMTQSRMFDDLHKLVRGDTFVVWTLGEPYAYKVYDIETVLPDQIESLAIQPGRDLCTLVTCTPYGVNSHRLLVHGERCEYQPEMAVAPLQTYANDRTVPFMVGVLVVASVLFVGARRRKIKKH